MNRTVARDTALDRLRGLAVVLMVLDHVTKVGIPLPWLTLTITRLSMPLFIITAGVLLARRSHSIRPLRALDLFLAGSVVTVVFGLVGLSMPDVLLVLLLTVPLWSWVRSAPVAAIVLGIVQFVNLPIGWGGYEPGFVVVLLAVGVLANGRDEWRAYGDRVPEWLALIGRRPLRLYVGHVAVLPLVSVVSGNGWVPGLGVTS